MFDAKSPRRGRIAVATIAVIAVLVGASGIAMTAHALVWEPRSHPRVRALAAAELPSDIPAVLALDGVAAGQVVGMLDTLRRMDRKPHDVDWLHFRCVEAATVLSAEPIGDPTTFREQLIEAFQGWTHGVGKDADYLSSPDGHTEIAIPFGSGRDAVDSFAIGLRPGHLVALAYRLRPC